jgi:glycosyltransferase involved in cell wall biosynthesis
LSTAHDNSAAEIRVLAIVPSGFCFGLQNLTLSIFENVSARINARFITTRWTDGEFARRLEIAGLAYSATWLGMFSRKLDWANVKMTLLCLAKLPEAWLHVLTVIWKFKPDRIYLANHHEAILLWPLLLLCRRRVICHMHDPPPPLRFQRLSFAVWRRAIGRFLFISNSARARTAFLGKVSADDPVIYNGVLVRSIEIPRTRNARFTKLFGWSADCVVVGLTGQMHANKGHEDFLAAARTAATIDSNLRFVIGGRNEGVFPSHLRSLASELGLADKVGFCGWLPAAQDFYEAVDILVLASRHEEGFGLVVAEAMERSVAVVATRSGGASEIIEDGVSGLLVPKMEPSLLAAAINQLGGDSALRDSVAQAGRKRIERHFNLMHQTLRFEELLGQ